MVNNFYNKTGLSLKSFDDYSQHALALQPDVYTDIGCGWKFGSLAVIIVTDIYQKLEPRGRWSFSKWIGDAIKINLNSSSHSFSASFPASLPSSKVNYWWKLIRSTYFNHDWQILYLFICILNFNLRMLLNLNSISFYHC